MRTPPRSGSIFTTFINLLLLGVLASPLLAQPEPKDKQEEKDQPPARANSLAGEVAPVGRWYTAGGSASRCGVSAAGPIFTDTLGTAWEYPVDGEIEEEPLTWDDHVVLVTVPKIKQGEAAKERTLHVLRLADGKPRLPPRKVASDVPLGPSMWGRLIAYRDGKNAIRVDQIGDTQFVQRMRYKTAGEVSPPLLFGNEIYYTQDGRLERIDLGTDKPAWSLEGNFRGRVSLLGDHVLALRFARLTEPTLAVVDRFGGKALAQEGSGVHGHSVDSSLDVMIAVSRGAALAHYKQPGTKVSTGGAGDIEINVGIWGRRSSVGAERLFQSISVASFVPPCLYGAQTLLFLETEAGAGWVMMYPDKRGWIPVPIANTEHYPDILARRVPCTLLGQTAVVGDLAFDRETLEIVWRADVKPTQRTVPGRQTLLVSTSGKLIALRDARPQTSAADAAAGARDLKKGTAVLRDGRVVRGGMRLDPGTSSLGVAGANKKVENVPLSQVLWAEDDGVVVHFGDELAVVRALLLVVEDKLRDGYASLAKRSIQSNDAKTISRLLVQALELGADERGMVEVQRQVAALRQSALRVATKVMKDVEGAEDKLRSEVADVAWKRAQALPASAPDWLRWLLPEMALSFDPKHAGVAAWVRAQLPSGMPVPEPFVAEQWRSFARSAKQRPMRVLAEGDPAYPWEIEQLGKAKASWRKDLLAVCSDRMCVLVPQEVVGAAGRCLATGELVIDALESMFAGIGSQRAGDKRMLIKLYATRDEYLEKAAQEALVHDKARKQREKEEAEKAGESLGEDEKESDDPKAQAEKLLGLKAFYGILLGFYVPGEQVTRLYLPAGKEGLENAIATFSHELTHQWLDLRGPRYPVAADAKPQVVLPGYWIVEGFASFVESFVWDVEGRRWDTDTTNRRFETFASAAGDQRNPWSKQLTVNHANLYRRFSTAFDKFIRLERFLGDRQTSQVGMFYCQAAAACHYLYHADDSKHRKALLEYVVHYYSGHADRLAPDVAFGMSADELGQRVGEYAKRPKK